MATNPLLHRETGECGILFSESGVPALDSRTAPSVSFNMKDFPPVISINIRRGRVCLCPACDTLSTPPMDRTVLLSINGKIERTMLWGDRLQLWFRWGNRAMCFQLLELKQIFGHNMDVTLIFKISIRVSSHSHLVGNRPLAVGSRQN